MSLPIPSLSPGFLEGLWLLAGVFSVFRLRPRHRPAHVPVGAAEAKADSPRAPEAAAHRNPIAEIVRPEQVEDDPAVGTPEGKGGPSTPRDEASPPGDARPERGEGLQILVAEDNPINRKVMQLLLRRMGYEADMAVDGQEAVEMAEAKLYDVILMDLHMPRMGGIEATETIILRLDPAPRIVAVTADATQQARDECKRVGMAAYLTKPVDSNQLLAELREAEVVRAHFGRTG
ncbi:MAG: CheY-like chemotaxis protein [Thalassolituus oleivorans]|jgi:CheY-like chemotaxis protein